MNTNRDVILGIEISNPGARGGGAVAPGTGVGLGRMSGYGGEGVEVLGVEPVRARAAAAAPARGGHDDDLMPAIDRLFVRLGVSARARLARVAVSVGPGGFTSLRVACAAGKMIAEACGAACVSVPSARVVYESAPADVRAAGPVAIALASKGDSAWVEVLGAGGSPMDGNAGRIARAGDVQGLAARGVRTLIADGHLPGAMREAAAAAGLRVLEPVFDAGMVVRLGAVLPAVDPAGLNPVYPREPDAVTLWRSRRAGG